MSKSTRIAIIGTGITGLSTAYYLRRQRPDDQLQITLLEASDRIGGKIYTEQFADVPVDIGAEAFQVNTFGWSVMGGISARSIFSSR